MIAQSCVQSTGAARPRCGRMALAAVVAGALLAGCGSTVGSPGSAGTAARSAASSSARGASSAAQGAATGGGPALPGAPALESVTNYRFRFTSSGGTFTGEVHSPSDWQIDQPVVERHVGPVVYIQVGGTWVAAPEAASSYTSGPYVTSVTHLVALLRLPGTRVARGAACTVAGVSGHSFTVATAQPSAPAQRATACIADRGGGLLSDRVAAPGSAGAAAALEWSFVMTGVGDVPLLPAPSAAGA